MFTATGGVLFVSVLVTMFGRAAIKALEGADYDWSELDDDDYDAFWSLTDQDYSPPESHDSEGESDLGDLFDDVEQLDATEQDVKDATISQAIDYVRHWTPDWVGPNPLLRWRTEMPRLVAQKEMIERTAEAQRGYEMAFNYRIHP